ncbi:hypothetical protein BDV27DRAFT_119852 [Aspergillus caelatus]|uniref:Uncharacterized protein n=1 Tax=Aspergillus caelatus TaxID=61420 RepID=A0A5N7AMN0_9EURO|nr:uncharacterized protein BDV27DRAFT_119852 [Aspergillus caelatus]KAE8370249.1 hypothetical protein BDV27DRAFT_119852 [Aspergillus caelatus]
MDGENQPLSLVSDQPFLPGDGDKVDRPFFPFLEFVSFLSSVWGNYLFFSLFSLYRFTVELLIVFLGFIQMPACINMNENVAFSRVIIGILVWCPVPPSGHVVLRLLEFSRSIW